MPRRGARLAREGFPLRRLLLANHADPVAVAGEVANVRHWGGVIAGEFFYE